MRGVLLGELAPAWGVDSLGAECTGRLCDRLYVGTPGHDMSGRFVPFWHRYGGQVRLEANIDYDKPESELVFRTRHGEERKSSSIRTNIQSRGKPCSFQAVQLQFSSRQVRREWSDLTSIWIGCFEAADEPGLFEIDRNRCLAEAIFS